MENQMNVTLVHPTHGAKVAINEVEIAEDEKNGWTRYNPATPVEVAPKADKPVRNKLTRKVTEQPVEQPNEVPSFLTSASDESEGN
jgi:glycine betaine/choline ABC-type transport system substrate-binding protein